MPTVGDLLVRLRADSSNFEQSMNQAQRTTNRTISQVRRDVTTMASDFRNQGMNASEAMTRAWQEVGNSTNELGDNMDNLSDTVDNDTRSMASRAASLAAEYRRQGMSQSEAMTRAWAEIRQQTNEGTDHVRSRFSTMGSYIKENLGSIGAKMTAVGAGITATIGGLVMAGAEWNASVAGQEFLYDNLNSKVQQAISNGSQEAEAIGLTTQQYKNAATTIATYYKNMGFASEETSKLSTESMDLVADLAAITDMPFDEAMDRFKSGLMGNYEALDAFGINVSAATLENSEYVKSLGKSWNQLSDNEKMMAVYNEIVRQSSSANGLAKQEAQSFGMQMKLLKQKLMETAGTIGEKLLPVLEPLVQKFVEIVEKVANWANENPKLTQAILVVVGVLGVLMTVVGPIISLFASLSMVASGLGIGMTALLGPIGIVIAVIAALIAVGVALYANWDTIKAKAGEVWNSIKETISSVMQNIKSVISTVWNTIKSFITTILNAIKTVVSTVWNAIKTVISTACNNIKSTISNIWNNIKTTINTILNNIKSVFSSWGSSMVSKAKSAMTNVKNTIGNTLKGAISTVKNIGSNIVSGLWNGISNKTGWLIGRIKSFCSNALGAIKSFFKIKSPSRVMRDEVGKYLAEGVGVGIEDNISYTTNAMGKLATSTINEGKNSFSSNSFNGNTRVGDLIKEVRLLRELVSKLELILNIDGKEFVREVVAPHQDELDDYNNTRNPKLAY